MRWGSAATVGPQRSITNAPLLLLRFLFFLRVIRLLRSFLLVFDNILLLGPPWAFLGPFCGKGSL